MLQPGPSNYWILSSTPFISEVPLAHALLRQASGMTCWLPLALC